MRVEDETPDDEGVAMAPLIDIVFLLLIFFLVSTTLKNVDKEIEVELPEVQATERVKKEESDFLVIGIDAEGQLFVDGEEATRTFLRTELRAISEDEPDRRIRLDTDRKAPFRVVAEVLDQIKVLNLSNFGIKASEEKENNAEADASAGAEPSEI